MEVSTVPNQTEIENEIMREYEQSLIIPTQPRRKLFILCPVGMIGAGKTTVLKLLAQKLSLSLSLSLSGACFRR